tara:strand:- start:347 stop:496 length:150 start_codon:yes stop_codon:yes gene_type:complete
MIFEKAVLRNKIGLPKCRSSKEDKEICENGLHITNDNFLVKGMLSAVIR